MAQSANGVFEIDKVWKVLQCLTKALALLGC
jgi:hypothetical protein